MKMRASKFKRGIPVILIGALALIANVHAQDNAAKRVSVGDTLVNGGVIKPYTNSWKLTYKKTSGETVEAAIWTDKVERVQIGHRNLMRRVQVARYLHREVTTTLVNIFDAKTLAPISRDFRVNNGRFNHIDFDGTSIKYQRADAPGTDVKRGVVELGDRVFDFFGGDYGILLASFPLRTGFSATFLSLDESTDTIRDAAFQVLRKETVEAGPGKRVNAWVVQTDDNGVMTFWLTKRPPYVIKLVYVNPQGIEATYTMN